MRRNIAWRSQALKQVCSGNAVHGPGSVIEPGALGAWQKTAKHFLVLPDVTSQHRERIAVGSLGQVPDLVGICCQRELVVG